MAAGAQPVTGRRGGFAAAAGRTVLAAGTASLDWLVLCSASQGAQRPGLAPDSLRCPITRLPLPPGQVEVAPRAAPEGQWEEPREGAALGQRDAATQDPGDTGPQPGSSRGSKVKNGPTSRHLSVSVSGLLYHTCHPPNPHTRRICVCPIHLGIPGAKDSVWHTAGAH